MPSALGYGLMGGAAAGLDKLGQQVEMQQAEAREEAKTERLRAAQLRDQEVIAEIRAHYEGVKDERKHSQAKELKGMELTSAEKRAEAARTSADARSEKSASARIKAAEISANRPRGSGNPAKPSYRVAELPDGSGWGYVDPATGKFSTDEEGTPIKAAPPYRERQGADAKKVTTPSRAKQSQKAGKVEAKKEDSARPGSSPDNPIEAASTATRPPSGDWVRLPSGKVVQVP